MTERNRELGYLAAVAALTGLGFASVYIARQAVIGWGSLTYWERLLLEARRADDAMTCCRPLSVAPSAS